MARVSKEYGVRRGELMAAANRLFQVHGYENTSVNMIIEDVGISKGTFYHYFKSKVELLESLCDWMVEQIMAVAEPVLDETELSAGDKLSRMFELTGSLKLQNRELMLVMLRTVYRDENLLVRHKLVTSSVNRMAPLWTSVIQQGIDTGEFDVEHPLETAEMIIRIGADLGATVAPMFIALLEGEGDRQVLQRRYDHYEESVCRILGAQKGAVRLLQPGILDRFLDSE